LILYGKVCLQRIRQEKRGLERKMDSRGRGGGGDTGGGVNAVVGKGN
jgi:hypothetical protein